MVHRVVQHTALLLTAGARQRIACRHDNHAGGAAARRAALLVLAGIAVGAGVTVLTVWPQLNRRMIAPALEREATALWRGATAPYVDQAIVQCWGDSLTAGTGATPGHDIPTLITYLFHRKTINDGLPGATSAQIAARMLARPPSPNPESIVIWAGRNDDPADPETTLRNIAAMIASLPPGSRFLVVSVLNADSGHERLGGDRYALLAALNRRLAARYGDHFLSLRAALMAQAVPADSDDRAAIAADVLPPSLRADALHLNDKGDALAAYAIEAALERDASW